MTDGRYGDIYKKPTTTRLDYPNKDPPHTIWCVTDLLYIDNDNEHTHT